VQLNRRSDELVESLGRTKRLLAAGFRLEFVIKMGFEAIFMM